MTLLLSARAAISADKIAEIRIEGNDKVSTKKILKNISALEGQEYDARKTGKDISAIYDMGDFDDVSMYTEEISSGSVRVVYKVEEKPVIKKIEFKGNEEIKSKKLLKKIESKEGEFFDDFTLQEDSRKIEEFYSEKGFAECKTEAYTTEDEEKNEAVLTFFVNEGNKIEIEKITLVGVVGEKYKKVRKQIKTKEKKVYKKDQLDVDIANVKTFYKNNGYLNVEIDDLLITYDESHNYMYITVFIFEGDKYSIGNVEFFGNLNATDDEINEVVKLKKGTIYSEEKVKENMFAIQEFYGNKGYIRMLITPNYTYDNELDKVDVTFNINEGPKVYIRNIYLDGNYVTKDYVIVREYKIKEGEPFNLEKVRKTQAEIFRLGFFKDVRIEMLPAGSADKTDIVFIVEEQKTGMASVGAGYSSMDGLIGSLRVTQTNLLGRGQTLSAMWEFGSRTQNYRIDFIEPWLFNTPTPFSASIYNTDHRRYYKDYGYNEQRRGGSVSLGRHFTDEFTAFLKYSLEQVKIYNARDAIKDELNEGTDTTSSITPSASYDTRDYPFDPSKGYLIRASNQIAGGIFGGDRDFNRLNLSGTYFRKIIWRIIFVTNVDAGVISAYGDSDEVPIYEKYNVGGAESVRGYEYWGEIGPPEGGDYKLVFNNEIKFPIVSEKGMTILQGAFFYDIGSTWRKYQDIVFVSGIEENKLKRGYGFGIRFKTRAFPIRLDWGYGIDKRPKDSQWYFTLGDIF